MSSKSKPPPDSIVKKIKRKISRKYSAEEKICIVLEGLRGKRVAGILRIVEKGFFLCHTRITNFDEYRFTWLNRA